jgi:hypothetical protein
MKTPKETVKDETESSDHDFAFEKLISDINSDLMLISESELLNTILDLPWPCCDGIIIDSP